METSIPEAMEVNFEPQPGPSNINESIFIPYAQVLTPICYAEQEEVIFFRFFKIFIPFLGQAIR